jgi:chromosome segregation ATPase
MDNISSQLAKHDKDIGVMTEQLSNMRSMITEGSMNSKTLNEYIKKIDITLEKLSTLSKYIDSSFNKIEEIEKRQSEKRCLPFVDISHKIEALDKEDKLILSRLKSIEEIIDKISVDSTKTLGFVSKAEKIIWAILGTVITVGTTYYFNNGGM